ncbi:hypothetical protein B0H16DRAFT_553008 [Mycena metata]|uniref:Uncharacterized protein n=1 Tax=Mycena metata TaxID=1033252 RepID=A0AAD7H633_9AGAR|nr:hypothetical protein B0H16DRAFT_553008 [Mycena metata]
MRGPCVTACSFSSSPSLPRTRTHTDSLPRRNVTRRARDPHRPLTALSDTALLHARACLTVEFRTHAVRLRLYKLPSNMRTRTCWCVLHVLPYRRSCFVRPVDVSLAHRGSMRAQISSTRRGRLLRRLIQVRASQRGTRGCHCRALIRPCASSASTLCGRAGRVFCGLALVRAQRGTHTDAAAVRSPDRYASSAPRRACGHTGRVFCGLDLTSASARTRCCCAFSSRALSISPPVHSFPSTYAYDPVCNSCSSISFFLF